MASSVSGRPSVTAIWSVARPAALGEVAVHVDARRVVVVHQVAADDRAIATVRDVDAMLGLRVVRFIEFDGEVISATLINSPNEFTSVKKGDQILRELAVRSRSAHAHHS